MIEIVIELTTKVEVVTIEIEEIDMRGQLLIKREVEEALVILLNIAQMQRIQAQIVLRRRTMMIKQMIDVRKRK